MTTRTRKPKIEYYWTLERGRADLPPGHIVNWRLISANGETMCQSTQGFRDKTDARRSVNAVGLTLTGYHPIPPEHYKEVGPGRKPGTGAAN